MQQDQCGSRSLSACNLPDIFQGAEDIQNITSCPIGCVLRVLIQVLSMSSAKMQAAAFEDGSGL